MSDFLNELAYAGSPYEGKANLVKMNPDFMTAFDQMAHEYYTQTGKEIKVDDAWRSEEAQAEGYRRKPNLVAPPGHSKHPKGLAMDLNPEQANQLAQMGLLDKYGFERPMLGQGKSGKNEPWHIEMRNLEKETGARAAEVKPDFMKELGQIDTSFGQDLAAVGEQKPTSIDGQAMPIPPGGQGVTPPTQAPAGQLSPDQLAMAAQQGENVANVTPGPAQTLPQAVGMITPVVKPLLEAGGLVGGGIIGSGATPIAGTVAGAGLGYAMGKKAGEVLEAYAGQREAPPLTESLKESAKDVATGAMMEVGGQVGGKVLGKGLELAGKGIRPVLGRMSGVGTGGVEEALRGSKDFVKALRGNLTGDEVVENAQMALQTIKNTRAADYQAKLANVAKVNQEINLAPLNQKVQKLMNQYNVKVNPDGTFDTSRIAMGKKGRNDIEDILETLLGKKDAKGKPVISSWGSKPGDKTPLGLDTLKRQLDDFYSESSQARAFVANLRNSVRDLIVKNVPEYRDMTKGYAEATKLIKDIEAGLMMRKQGMSGRIVADQTLRRLVSSMKDNFELRRELVDVLGEESGTDIAGQIAGHAMNTILPRGLAGLATITEGGLALAKFINPKIWPFLVASSPRVQGEFLQVFGKALKETKGASLPVGKLTAYLSLMQREAQKDNQNPLKKRTDALLQQGKTEDARVLLRDAVNKGKIGVDKAVEWLGDTGNQERTATQ